MVLFSLPLDITQCQQDRVLSRDPRLRLEFLPRCNADGSYHVIQCSVHLNKCWCVDQSGHKSADAVDGDKGMHCTKPKSKETLNLSRACLRLSSLFFACLILRHTCYLIFFIALFFILIRAAFCFLAPFSFSLIAFLDMLFVSDLAQMLR